MPMRRRRGGSGFTRGAKGAHTPPMHNADRIDTNAAMRRAADKPLTPLWPADTEGIDAAARPEDVAPGKFRTIRNPALIVYEPPPDTANGEAVVVCPGGGYSFVSCINEGYPVAEWLCALGFRACVLLYRLPATEGVNYRHPVPLKDAQRAMRMVRRGDAGAGQIPLRVGIIGFSAGGHLAAAALTLFADPVDPDPTPCRPDFGILVYPVISLHDRTLYHGGSREALLGPDATPEALRAVSPELHVGPDTPPVLLVHARDDTAVPYGNSVVLHEALRAAGVPSALHLYDRGGHGFGMGAPGDDSAAWPETAAAWLAAR
jgi:acetyl esterase/lipase